MIYFIIYEDVLLSSTIYQSLIHQFLGDMKKKNYRIFSCQNYHEFMHLHIEHLDGIKIFIFDVEVPGKNGLDLAREIRTQGDRRSQIILLSDFEHYQHSQFTRRTLALDFLSKKAGDFKNLFLETLNTAYTYSTEQFCFSFLSDGDTIQIPYQNILYFEKIPNDNVTVLHTIDRTYPICSSLINIEKKLHQDPRFFKSHRSCIVNLFNIDAVNFHDNTIQFKNDHEPLQQLISRDKRHALRKKLTDSQFFL